MVETIGAPVIASIMLLVVGAVVLLFGPLIVANVYNAMTPSLGNIGGSGKSAAENATSLSTNLSVNRTISNFYSAVNITGVALILIGVGALFWALRGGLGVGF